MNPVLAHRQLKCDLCIVGGGLSGSFAALAAARHGKNVILMQDRPMLGGNASSEIRMWVRGARGPYNRETGLISELEERNIHGNPTLVSLGVALAIDGVDPNFSFLDIIPYNFHCWGLMLIFLLSILTGIGRRFEKPEETANA